MYNSSGMGGGGGYGGANGGSFNSPTYGAGSGAGGAANAGRRRCWVWPPESNTPACCQPHLDGGILHS
jgi:hypothetical protein